MSGGLEGETEHEHLIASCAAGMLLMMSMRSVEIVVLRRVWSTRERQGNSTAVSEFSTHAGFQRRFRVAVPAGTPGTS